jgi:sugar/nucleoside kinase (ribokinase family)
VSFAKGEEWGTEDIAEIAAKLAAMPGPKQATRKAVVTQGADATVIATSGKGVETVPVAGNPWSLKKEDLVDTNGAAAASQKRPAAAG